MLKFFCAFTGYQYSMVSQDTPQSKHKVVLMGTAMLLPVLIWAINGLLLSWKVLGAHWAIGIVVGIFCAFAIFIIEKLIIMSTVSKAMVSFRLIMGFAVALLGAIALDEIILKEDIDHQLNINKEEAIANAKSKENNRFDSAFNLIKREEDVRLAKIDFDNATNIVIREAEGKGSGTKGVGSITRLKEKKAEEKRQIWLARQTELRQLLNERERAVLNAGKEKEMQLKDGLLVRVKALFQMVFSDWAAGLFYLLLTIIMFGIEFIVVLVKACTPKTNVDRKMELIEEIGKRRLEMLLQPDAPLVSKDYTLASALSARGALVKKNGSLFN